MANSQLQESQVYRFQKPTRPSNRIHGSLWESHTLEVLKANTKQHGPGITPRAVALLSSGVINGWPTGNQRYMSYMRYPWSNRKSKIYEWYMRYSPLETNIFALENGWLEYDPFLLGQKVYFQVRSVSFRECIWKRWIQLWSPKNYFSWWVFCWTLKTKATY